MGMFLMFFFKDGIFVIRYIIEIEKIKLRK